MSHTHHNSSNKPLLLSTKTGNVSPKYHCVYDNEFETCKRDTKFKSLRKNKDKLTEGTVERSEFDYLPTKPKDSRNDAILPDAIDPPSMFPTEWETPLTKNDEYSYNIRTLQSVPTLPTEFELNLHEFNHGNRNAKKTLPIKYLPTPQVGNYSPSTENYTNVTIDTMFGVRVRVRVKVRVKVRVRVYLRTNGGRIYVLPLFPGYERPVAHQVLGV